MLKGVGGERKMNAALCRIVFISVHPFGTYVSGMCRKSDAVGAAAAGMVRFGIWRGRGWRGERKMNAALRRVIFIAARPSGSYVSGVCQISDAAAMLRGLQRLE
jgi:hypothetical protein